MHRRTKLLAPAVALALAVSLAVPALAAGRSISLEYDAVSISNVVHTAQVSYDDPIRTKGDFADWGWNDSGFVAAAPVTISLTHEAEFYVADANGKRVPFAVSKPAPYDYAGDMLPGTSVTLTQPGVYAVFGCSVTEGDAGMGGEGHFTKLTVVSAAQAANYPGVVVKPSFDIIRNAENKHALNMTAYLIPAANGNSSNFVKLRDVAAALSGTPAQFDVGWDQASATITITTGTAYTGEQPGYSGFGANDYAQAVPNSAKLLLDGKPIELEAYTIQQNNYFMLRDLGKAIGFNVYWNSESAEAFVDAAEPYTGNP